MPCLTCSHTMQNLGLDATERTVYWCPRCGSLKTVMRHMGKDYEGSEAPKVVDRVREFVRMIDDTSAGRWFKTQAEVSGVLESTHKPEER